MFRYLVLGLLNSGAPRHGYALMKAYRDRGGTKVSTGNFYRDLQHLVAHGFVRTIDRKPGDDPRRISYQITDQGRDVFRSWFTNPAYLTQGHGQEDSLSFRIALISDVETTDARAVIEHLQEELWTRAKSLERVRSAALASGTSHATNGLPVLALMLGRRLRHVSAELAFLDDLRANYDDWSSGISTPRKTASSESLHSRAREGKRSR